MSVLTMSRYAYEGPSSETHRCPDQAASVSVLPGVLCLLVSTCTYIPLRPIAGLTYLQPFALRQRLRMVLDHREALPWNWLSLHCL